MVSIAETDGLYHASAMFTGGAPTTRHHAIASLHAQHDLDPERIAKKKQREGANQPPRLHKKTGQKRRSDFGAVRTFNTRHEAPVIQWDLEGDPDRIKPLLYRMDFIGAHRARGAGQARRWQIDDADLNGLYSLEREPLWPIPVAMYQGAPDHVVADAGWRPAYWHPTNRAACFIPSDAAEGLGLGDGEDMLGFVNRFVANRLRQDLPDDVPVHERVRRVFAEDRQNLNGNAIRFCKT